MNIENLLEELTLDEKVKLLTGAESLSTAEIERLNIKKRTMADGPHGLRLEFEDDCTQFPNLCSLAATWNVECANKMGIALANECIYHNIDMLLAPGINIKRNILCGRNFEYLSEDPHLTGELAAAYINGLEKNGVSTSLKHFAVNNQETLRNELSVEADERTLREIYLRGFEIAIKKSNPTSVMCSYNKLGGIWCSENPHLLTEILKKEWGYDGFVVSDWGAVHDIIRAVKAGLDLEMPNNSKTPDILKNGIKDGLITEEEINKAVKNVLKFLIKPENKTIIYNRDEQHNVAKEIAAEGIVLLKNEEKTLPLTENKYKKIAVIGEFADKPLISGQGSAEVKTLECHIESPLTELRKNMPNTEFKYIELYKKGEFSPEMLWPKCEEVKKSISDCDAVILFTGSMVSEDTENFDRRSPHINKNHEWYAEFAANVGKKVIIVMQTGGAVILGSCKNKACAIVQMWLAGEGAGSAIADVLCGKINPSGKLPETFPTRLRKDIDSISEELIIPYTEKLEVGYRYYDKHPEEICYPFGFGLSYTEFKYSDISIEETDNNIKVSFFLENIGKYDGKEIVQLYISDPICMVSKPKKELKAFKKVFVKAGDKKEITFNLSRDDFSYYNEMLHKWVAEDGIYTIMIAASSQDIRLKSDFNTTWETPYSIQKIHEARIG